MKNIAMPLLLASSAKAGAAKKDSMMEADFAFPDVQFMAPTYWDGLCQSPTVTVGSTVAEAVDALATAMGSLEESQLALEAPGAALTLALEAKTLAVTNVITADEALAVNLAADDAAQISLLLLKTALDNATYAHLASTGLAASASSAKDTADDAHSNATDVQTAMSTAADNALTHYEFEQAQTAAEILLRDAAEDTKNNAAALTSGLSDLYDSAKVTSDAALETTATSLIAKNDAAALLAELTTTANLAAAALIVGTPSSVAEAKQTEDTALGLLNDALVISRDAWVLLAKATVKAMANWLLADAYTSAVLAIGCDGDLSLAQDTANSTGDGATGDGTHTKCVTLCNAALAWTIASNLPAGALTAGGAANAATFTHCYGYEYDSAGNVCKAVLSKIPSSTGRGQLSTFDCLSRNKSGFATPLITASGLSAASQAEYILAFTTDLNAWGVRQNTVLAAVGNLKMATEYEVKILARKNQSDSDSTAASGAYDGHKGTSDGNLATTTTKNENLTDNQTLVVNTTAAWQALVDSVTAQESEESRQLAIKTLADSYLLEQNGVVDTLLSAKGDAADALLADNGTVTDDLATKEGAQTAYDDQVDAADLTAAAVVDPLSALSDLRGLASTAGDDLSAASGDVDDAQSEIDGFQDAVDLATGVKLAAIVACKGARFDEWSALFDDNVEQRETDLDTIAGLIDDAIAAMPAAGAAGARCEKAMSNGTFRPARGETTCDTGLCCGAARIPVGAAVMIIETCQAAETTEFEWAPPRAPMATEMPGSDPFPFTCIEGAQKLAAAASALAAAVYMLA